MLETNITRTEQLHTITNWPRIVDVKKTRQKVLKVAKIKEKIPTMVLKMKSKECLTRELFLQMKF